jgi:hypothetical protein
MKAKAPVKEVVLSISIRYMQDRKSHTKPMDIVRFVKELFKDY